MKLHGGVIGWDVETASGLPPDPLASFLLFQRGKMTTRGFAPIVQSF